MILSVGVSSASHVFALIIKRNLESRKGLPPPSLALREREVQQVRIHVKVRERRSDIRLPVEPVRLGHGKVVTRRINEAGTSRRGRFEPKRADPTPTRELLPHFLDLMRSFQEGALLAKTAAARTGEPHVVASFLAQEVRRQGVHEEGAVGRAPNSVDVNGSSAHAISHAIRGTPTNQRPRVDGL